MEGILCFNSPHIFSPIKRKKNLSPSHWPTTSPQPIKPLESRKQYILYFFSSPPEDLWKREREWEPGLLSCGWRFLCVMVLWGATLPPGSHLLIYGCASEFFRVIYSQSSNFPSLGGGGGGGEGLGCRVWIAEVLAVPRLPSFLASFPSSFTQFPDPYPKHHTLPLIFLSSYLLLSLPLLLPASCSSFLPASFFPSFLLPFSFLPYCLSLFTSSLLSLSAFPTHHIQ